MAVSTTFHVAGLPILSSECRLRSCREVSGNPSELSRRGQRPSMMDGRLSKLFHVRKASRAGFAPANPSCVRWEDLRQHTR